VHRHGGIGNDGALLIADGAVHRGRRELCAAGEGERYENRGDYSRDEAVFAEFLGTPFKKMHVQTSKPIRSIGSLNRYKLR
jgi:hypothetical protein